MDIGAFNVMHVETGNEPKTATEMKRVTAGFTGDELTVNTLILEADFTLYIVTVF